MDGLCKDLKIGDIYLMKFCGSGSEQCGWRPGLVFQNNTGNLHSPNIIALPLTSCIKKVKQPTHVFVSASDTDLKYDSIILCENPERMSKERVGKYITSLPSAYMKEVAAASILSSSVISFLDPDRLIDLWNIAVALNRAGLTA